jgi:hypothetical protein
MDNKSFAVNPPQSPKMLNASPSRRVLWKISAAFTLVVIAFVLWQCGSGLVMGRRLAEGAVDRFHNQLNSGKYDQIYNEASDAFRNTGTRKELVGFFQAVHAKLGNSTSCRLVSMNVNTMPPSTFITAVYSTTFTQSIATETFTWHKGIGRLELSGYNIQSSALLTN